MEAMQAHTSHVHIPSHPQISLHASTSWHVVGLYLAIVDLRSARATNSALHTTRHHPQPPRTQKGDRMHSRIACVIRRASVGIVIRSGSGPVYGLSMLPASPCADTRPTPAAIAATAATPVQRTAHHCVPGTPMFRSGRVSHVEVGPETMHRHTHTSHANTRTRKDAHSPYLSQL